MLLDLPVLAARLQVDHVGEDTVLTVEPVRGSLLGDDAARGFIWKLVYANYRSLEKLPLGSHFLMRRKTVLRTVLAVSESPMPFDHKEPFPKSALIPAQGFPFCKSFSKRDGFFDVCPRVNRFDRSWIAPRTSPTNFHIF